MFTLIVTVWLIDWQQAFDGETETQDMVVPHEADNPFAWAEIEGPMERNEMKTRATIMTDPTL